MPLFEKIRTIAREIYRAKDVTADKAVKDQLAAFEALGYGTAPICVAKTQYSFSTNPDAKGAPVDHTINVREVRLSAGAEFVVAICGEIMTMPGLPKVPAAESIDVGRGRQDRRIVLESRLRRWLLRAASSLASPARADRSTACACSRCCAAPTSRRTW